MSYLISYDHATKQGFRVFKKNLRVAQLKKGFIRYIGPNVMYNTIMISFDPLYPTENK